MPSKTSHTASLQDEIDRAVETLEAAYQPETTREELAQATGEALDILHGEIVDDDEENGD